MTDDIKEGRLRIAPLPATLSPATVLRVANQEILGWEEGAPIQSTVGKATLEAYLASLKRLCNAGSEADVQEAITSFVEYCDSLGRSTSTPYNLQAEIFRRKQWLKEQASAQEEYEEEFVLIENSLRELNEKLRFSKTEDLVRAERSHRARREAVSLIIQGFVSLCASVRSELQLLEQYQRSQQLIESGLPRVNLDSLPAMVIETVHVPVTEFIAAETEASEKPAAELTGLSERRGMIALVAAEYNFLEVEVLVYSLFDILGIKNCHIDEDSRRAIRGPGKVVGHALELFPDLQWETPRAVFMKSGWTNEYVIEREYLLYRGTPMGRGMGVFLRSEKPLPWDRTLIFTSEEAAAFLTRVRNP